MTCYPQILSVFTTAYTKISKTQQKINRPFRLNPTTFIVIRHKKIKSERYIHCKYCIYYLMYSVEIHTSAEVK